MLGSPALSPLPATHITRGEGPVGEATSGSDLFVHPLDAVVGQVDPAQLGGVGEGLGRHL